MAEDKNENGKAAASNGDATPPAQPSIGALTQYTKDLSFENPMAPQSLAQQASNPKISIEVNVTAKPLAPDTFEVNLTIDAKAKGVDAEDKETVVFAIDLTYGGVFRIQNVPEASLHPMVMIECPRLLFPFARQIVADATRNGGYPPLMIDPIDFAALYRQRLEAQAKEGSKGELMSS